MKFGYMTMDRASYEAGAWDRDFRVGTASLDTASPAAAARLLLIMRMDLTENSAEKVRLVCYDDSPVSECQELDQNVFRRILGYLADNRIGVLRDAVKFMLEWEDPEEAEGFLTEEFMRPILYELYSHELKIGGSPDYLENIIKKLPVL